MRQIRWPALLSEYGMLVVLLLLCVVCSLATIAEQQPTDSWTADRLAARIAADYPNGSALVVGLSSDVEQAFVEAVRDGLQSRGVQVVDALNGKPVDARRAIGKAIGAEQKIDVVVASLAASKWPIYDPAQYRSPLVAKMQVVAPKTYRWPTFLLPRNLRNVVDQVSIIAIISIGMTMVIISGGIDLSVGSLMAFSSVIIAIVLREASELGLGISLAMLVASLAAVGMGAGVGCFTGTLVTRCRVPPFIVTLGLMMSASGLAYVVALAASQEQTVPVPESFKILGHGKLLGIPYSVLLMFALYAVAHLAMTRSVFGRHLYAVGGNERAAHLSGIRVSRVRTWTYVICAALAALGGVIETSIYGRGDPKIGDQYELLVISAVVVGGTSLSGGEGKMFNTLIGSLIIAVIRNAMNLANLDGNWQQVVLGAVILGAVLIDRLKRK